MNVDTRDRPAVPAPGQRAPRSGGRAAAQSPRSPGRAAAASPGSRGRTAAASPGSRQMRAARSGAPATDGTAALAPGHWDEPREAAQAQPTAAPRRTGPRLRVAPPLPVSAPRAPFVGLILMLVVGGVLGILLVNTKINENAFRLDRLDKQQAALDLQQQQLQRQIADHEAPGNLAAAARRLGMVESDPPAFVRLPDGKIVGAPQPTDGADPGSTLPGAGG